MNAVLIINPVSGDAVPNEKKVDDIRKILVGGGLTLDVAFTSEEKPAGILAKEAVVRRVPLILVGGGDGTVSQVATELVFQRATLGIIPLGTFNNIARSLAIPDSIDGACRVILDGQDREIDVGCANGKQIFFEAAGAGLDAALFPAGEQIKGGRWSRLLEVARITAEFQEQVITITLDRPVHDAIPEQQRKRYRGHEMEGPTIRVRALLVAVANGPYYGGGFTISPGSRMSDGLLTVNVYRRFTKLELIRHFWSISHGKFQYSPKVRSFSAEEIELSTDSPIPVHVDGCPSGETPLKLRAVPRAVRLRSLEGS
jgi:diacylglycerol kinase (ATP)